MKTRNNYPYIYFFTEPNVVFVYEIRGDNYLTVSQLSKQGGWETYEITEGFEEFNHEEHSPLEGRGYFIRQDNVNFMVGKINELIRIHRKTSTPIKKNGPVHLVSSDSTAGALKVGLDQPKTVIAFKDLFSIGPLWKLDEKVGQDDRHNWLNENINLEQDDYELENHFTKTVLEIEDIPEDVPIYIWTANNGNEQTGLRFLLHILRNKENEIHVANTTELYKQWIHSNDEKPYSNMLHPDHLRVLFEKSQSAISLTQEERVQLLKEWELLTQSNEILRLWKNGKVTSVPSDYFDEIILETISNLHKKQEAKDFIRTGRVIGETIHKMEEIVGDSYLEYRIRHLIYSGALELKGIPRSMRHYSVKIPD
ncbi:DUF1835 domain-containing protein [Bacillus sp. 1P10SD]|uniref:DUF1835 domain-containing protein n=1 Tax=Bacillus sp. 1P10SD TaxID=3132265 RepID=UPI0039A536DE